MSHLVSHGVPAVSLALAHLPARMQQAIFEGDVDWLDAHAGCLCCCSEHTYGRGCPAWEWGGCRGYNASGLTTREEERAWAKHYETHHGMMESEFYGYQEFTPG